uniref:B30.2/SPRY domain-containing protein n=1 Tax=Haptolina brevifila TaxID=156173 RepID=A0A7S2NAR4_9EUKA
MAQLPVTWEVMEEAESRWKRNGNKITRKATSNFDAAFADTVLTDGQYELEFTIVEDKLGCVCQYLGVCDADHVYKREMRSSNPNDEEEEVAWAFSGGPGILWKFRSPHVEYGSGAMKTAMPKGQNLADPKKAKGSTVKLVVDMKQRSLTFQVNKEPVIDAGIELPAAVRPFVLLAQDETIKLTVKRVDLTPSA